MSVAIFLDTNIIEKNFNMEGSDFENLLEMINGSEVVEYMLNITEMNKYEVLKHYRMNLSTTFNNYNSFFNELRKLISEDNIGDFDIRPRDKKQELLTEYESDLIEIFDVIEPSEIAVKQAIERMYKKVKPCSENKEEIKDSIIWETINEYAVENSEEHVVFISDNNKDFAVKNKSEDGNPVEYVLHEDLDDLEGRIKYYKSIKEFLVTGIQYLKTHIFEHHDRDKILEQIKEYIFWNMPDNLHSEMESFFFNHEFEADYFSGWGTDPYINKIDVTLNEIDDVVITDDTFIIPCEMEMDIQYYIQNKSPTYERGDEEEYITSEPKNIDLLFTFEAIYNKKEQSVERIESVSVSDWI